MHAFISRVIICMRLWTDAFVMQNWCTHSTSQRPSSRSALRSAARHKVCRDFMKKQRSASMEQPARDPARRLDSCVGANAAAGNVSSHQWVRSLFFFFFFFISVSATLAAREESLGGNLRRWTVSGFSPSALFCWTKGAKDTAKMFLLSQVHWPVLVIWVSCTEETQPELSSATLIRRERLGGKKKGGGGGKGGKEGKY